MYNIKTLNNISDIIFETLTKNKYSVSEKASNTDAILVRSADMLKYHFENNTIAVARAGIGVNNIPIEECSKKGIVVFNTPGANANAVKELVLTSLLLSGRKIIEAIDWTSKLKNKKDIESIVEKNKSKFAGHELHGKTLGVLGLGSIGVMVANTACRGLGMKVIGYDPYISVDAAWKLSSSIIHAKNINEVFAKADYITVHIPSNEKTKGLINSSLLKLMKNDSVILNFSRDNLVNNKDILNAIESKKIRLYITDFPNEELVGHEGVLSIPHLGASTIESEENCALMASRSIKNYLEFGTITNSVNMPDCELQKSSDKVIGRICIINKNITNMVGQITSVLASKKINIEDMINKSRGDYAYNLIDISSKPTRECIDKIMGIEGIVRVRLINK